MSKLFDPTKPVQTRSGVPARIIASDAKQSKFPIIALVGEDSESAVSYGPQGEFYSSLARPDPRDLVNVAGKITRKVWINLDKDGHVGLAHDSKIEADEGAFQDRIACKEFTLEFEEGEGL